MSVTIAIPFYNAETFLEDAIRSVFAQTYRDWELLLLDDGSTDNSLQIAKSIKDSRVRVFSDGKNKKLAARLNEITKLAKYDYIARMDADDLMSPHRIEKQIFILENNPGLDLVTTGVYSVLNDLSLKGVRGEDYEYPKFLDILNKKKSIVHAAIVAKKSWYRRNKYEENLSVAQDLDLWLRASKKNDLKLKSIAEPLYIYREENNITKEKILTAYKNEREMLNKYASDERLKERIFHSYTKSTVIKLLNALGLLGKLQKRRANLELNLQMNESYKRAITTIKETTVSGLI